MNLDVVRRFSCFRFNNKKKNLTKYFIFKNLVLIKNFIEMINNKLEIEF